MAATNYTPIQLYHSTTASAVPVNTNLVNGELAINITDGKLYYKDNGGTVQVIASKGTGTIGGSTTQVQYNLSGALTGSSNFVFDGTTATINTLNLTNALGATYGGTAQSSWTTGDLLYASGSNTLAKLGIGLNTYILTSNGTIPGWAAPSAISVNTATNLAGGAAGSVPYQSGAGATTFLSIGTANQVVTSTGSAPQWSSGLSITTLTASDAVTFSATTQNIALGTSQTSGTFTIGGTAQTGNISIDRSTKTHTLNIGTGITESGQTKTINIGTAGDTGSTTAITIGSTNGTTITINGTVNASTLDLTNLEVTNIKAKDGTAAMSIADSTGVVSITANPVLSGGTANGVLYLNASKVATSGSALTFDGTKLSTSTFAIGNNTASSFVNRLTNGPGNFQLYALNGVAGNNSGDVMASIGLYFADTIANLNGGIEFVRGSAATNGWMNFFAAGSERMRLNGSSLNIGGNFTSTNNTLQVTGNAAIGYTTAAPTTGLIVAGNVGIGTDSPFNPVGSSMTSLTVSGTTYGSLWIQANSAAVRGTFNATSANNTVNLTAYTNHPLTFATDDKERGRFEAAGNFLLRQSSNAANTSVSFNTTVQNALTLDSDGDLGIGVATPAYRLSVQGSPELLADLYSTSAGFNTVLQFRNDNSANGRFGYYNGNFRWSVDNGVTQNMSLTSSGNLGIGTTNPGRNLTINATIPILQFTNPTSGTTANDGLLIYQNALNSYVSNQEAGSLIFETSNTERARIDSSGNLGLGVTPSVWGTLVPAFQIGAGGSFVSAQGSVSAVYIGTNAYYNGGWKYTQGTYRPSVYAQTSGEHRFYTAPSGTASTSTINATALTSAENGNSYTIAVAGTTDFTLIGAANNNVGTSFTKSGATGAGTGTVTQNIVFTQAMTLDASGNLGVGLTNPTARSGGGGGVVDANGPVLARGGLNTDQTNAGVLQYASDETRIRSYGATAGTGFMTFNTGGGGGSGDAERARITSGGYFKAQGASTYINSAGSYHEFVANVDNNEVLAIQSKATNGTQYGVSITTNNDQNDATRWFLICRGSGTDRAIIRSNGGLANYSANNVNLASDERLKKDISPLATTWDKLKQIEVVNFRYKDCNEGDPLLYGVIAQQVQPIVPELVVVTREAKEATEDQEATPEYYGIREQPMYWLAIKALQEAMARIEKLEAEVAALKGA